VPSPLFRKSWGLSLKELRMAVVSYQIEFAAALRVVIPLQVIDDEQVEQAVVVHIHPNGGDRPPGTEFWIRVIQSRVQS